MTDGSPSAGDPAVLVSSYEELRDRARRHVGGSGAGTGLAVFARRGMAAWLAACAPLSRSLANKVHREPASQNAVPADLRTEVAMVLAEMALTVVFPQGASRC